MTTFTPLLSLSPLEGRYHPTVESLRPIFSEYGLIKARFTVEISWLFALSNCADIHEVSLSEAEVRHLAERLEAFTLKNAEAVKAFEKTTHHDVKAVEYAVKTWLVEHPSLKKFSEWVHFACTSEDINNVAYALMLQSGRQVWLEALGTLIVHIQDLAHAYADIPMLSRTHGQAASPTTVGKELANVVYRLQQQVHVVEATPICAKFNGAVGNYNAHVIAYPEVDWLAVSEAFITDLGLTWNSYTTQIEPHDTLAELLDGMARINRILIDFCRDMWSYISMHYFVQKKTGQEVGSSTMPHKINPIHFENAEGNLGLSNALLHHFSEKLPISRLQRDLSDSTVLRNIGVAFGYSLLALQNIQQGLSRVSVNEAALQHDLNTHWEVLAEAIQTVMRRYGVDTPYEQLKALTQGKTITQADLIPFIQSLPIPEEAKHRLSTLTPGGYCGLAGVLAKKK
jgi:adenylosuccinate lyase